MRGSLFDTRRGSAIPEAFIGIAIAAILLIIYPHFIEYLLHPHNTPAFDAIDANGAVLPYHKICFLLVGFWHHILLPGVADRCRNYSVWRESEHYCLAQRRLSALAAVLNLWVISHTWGLAGFPLQCAVAIAIAVYTAMLQFQSAREA